MHRLNLVYVYAKAFKTVLSLIFSKIFPMPEIKLNLMFRKTGINHV